MHQSWIISIFSFILALAIAIIYWFLRIGFEDNSVSIILKVLGITAFILLLPPCLANFRKSQTSRFANVLLNDTFVPVIAILLIGGIGYVASIVKIDFSIIFIIAGYGFVIIAFYKVFKLLAVWNLLILIIAASLLALWSASVCWFIYLKPFIMEGWACGTDKIDTLFHISLAQMIKTYGIPTTGLDGVPFMNYHWGSHWIFAHLSNFLQIPVLVVYQLCFPLLIVPLLFRTFLSFAIVLKRHFKPEPESRKVNFIFLIIFFAIFIGFIPNFYSGNSWAEYSSGGTNSTLFMLISESYTVSIIIMLAVLSISVCFWCHHSDLPKWQQIIFVYVLLPLLLALLGWVKISTLFVVCCLIGYLFMRLKMFKVPLFSGGMVLAILTAFAIFSFVFETREDHGGFSFFFFYKQFNVWIPGFLLISYLWLYIFIVVFFLSERLYKFRFLNFFQSNRSIPLECALVVFFAGYLPTVLLRIQNYDALYFTEIHFWISGAFILTCIPFYHRQIQSKLSLFFTYGACMVVMSVFYINTKVYWRTVWDDRRNTWKCLIAQSEENRKLNVNEYSMPSVYRSNKVLLFLSKVKELDKLPLKKKRNSLVYVDFRSLITRGDYGWKLGCHNIAFTVPALSGMAMIDGIDVTYYELCGGCCEQIGLSYHYYPKWKTREQLNQPFDLSDLKRRAAEKGFGQLFIYNLKTESFEEFATIR